MAWGLNREAVERLGSPLARVVEVHEELGSTQERARELARAGAVHGTLVLSSAQTGGRGRRGRWWGSPPGGLWMSLVLTGIEPAHASRITQATAVGSAKALREYGARVRIKWPNDLLIGGRKVCGILAESSIGDFSAGHIVLGVGLNANLDPSELDAPEATTLRRELGRDVDLLELLAAVLSGLEDELDRLGDFGAILDDWRALDCTLGERVCVWRRGESLTGKAAGLSPEGALLLETEDGTVELFEGEVEQLRV